MAFKLIPVAPTGTRRSFCHLNRGSQPHTWEWVDIPTYPENPNGERLVKMRHDRDLSLRETAKALGLSAADYSGLERGSMAVDDWDALFAAMPQRKDSHE